MSATSTQNTGRPLKGEAGLFLAKAYDRGHLSHMGYTLHASEEHADAVKYVPGTIYVSAEHGAPVTVQNITIKLDNGMVFNYQNKPYTFYTMLIPTTPPGGRRGTLFTYGDGPQAGKTSSFWIQQFLSYGGEPYGRIVVDLVDDNGEHPQILGVFKTDGDNYGTHGRGIWE